MRQMVDFVPSADVTFKLEVVNGLYLLGHSQAGGQ